MATVFAPIDDSPAGTYHVELFFDPGCPFAWQTSVWMRKVQELRGIGVGWRFISLRFMNEGNEQPESRVQAQELGLRFHRVCAAARARFGNVAVGELYRQWGERLWYANPGTADVMERMAVAAAGIKVVDVLVAADLPADLADAANDATWDELIRAETEEALRRTGRDVGTPILTFSPPAGRSVFGPVISTVPDDATSLAIYDAVRTLADFPAFSELKRSNRAPLDLPLFAE